MDKLYYAGSGAINAPENIIRLMSDIASYMENKGYVLRSCGMEGSDTAFEFGVKSDKNRIIYTINDVIQENIDMAYNIYPYQDRVVNGDKYAGMKIIQSLGKCLTKPISLCIVWTESKAITLKESLKKYKTTGNCGILIGICEYYKIPIYNLAVNEHYNRIRRIINE